MTTQTIEAQNLQHVQEGYAAFGRGDIPFILGQMSPDVQWHDFVPREAPYGGLRKGPAEVGRFFQELAASVDITKLDTTDFLTNGDRVVALGTIAGTVKPTGKPFDARFAHVWTVQDGKTTGFNAFIELEVAREAWTK